MISSISPLIVGVPVLTTVVVLSSFAWRRWGQEKKTAATIEAAQATPLPADTVKISVAGDPVSGADRSGRIMIVLIGTFAENLGDNLLEMLARRGLHRAVGSVLLAEMDTRRRNRFLERVPSVYSDRIVPVGFTGLSGGLGNRSPEKVRDYIDIWGPPIIRGANKVCEVHQSLNRGEDPALILVFISQGGQAIIGTEALKTITDKFRLVQPFGLTALPVDDLLRQRVEYVLDAYREVGVEGFVVADNLNDEVRNDFGMLAAVAGFVSAAEDADASVEQNNAWRLLYEKAPGGLVSYSTFVNTIPGYRHQPHPELPPAYYVYKDTVVSSVLTGLEQVQRDDVHALGGQGRNGHVPLTSCFDIVLTAVVPEDLKRDEDDVVLARQLKGVDRRNHHLLFAPISTVIDPDRPLCPIGIVSLHALSDGPEVIRELTTPPALADSVKGSLPAPSEPNGASQDTVEVEV